MRAYGYRRKIKQQTGQSLSIPKGGETTVLIRSDRELGHEHAAEKMDPSLCSATKRSATELGHNHPNYHQSDEDAESKDALVLPPHLASHRARSTAKCRSLTRHVIRLVHQKFNALPATEDLLDVLDHDVLHLSKLRLRAGNVIRRGGCVVRVH